MAAGLLGVILALVSAVSWGSGDFSGGFVTRRLSQFQVVAISAAIGLLLLAPLALWRGEPLPGMADIFWAGAAGVSGALGIAALYRALSWGDTAMVAPTAAVIGAALPVVFSLFTRGAPQPVQLAGFALALLGIWFVTQNHTANKGFSRKHLLAALTAGAGFGGFFILLGQTRQPLIFMPLVIARLAMLGVATSFMLSSRLPVPSLREHPIALVGGVLDTGGNVFYFLATQFTRLDVAAVLASLYPAVTVLLARVLLKEEVSLRQWFGVFLCFCAIALIAA